jgi:hypothetical protein
VDCFCLIAKAETLRRDINTERESQPELESEDREKTSSSAGFGGVAVNKVNISVCHRDGIWITQICKRAAKTQHGIRWHRCRSGRIGGAIATFWKLCMALRIVSLVEFFAFESSDFILIFCMNKHYLGYPKSRSSTLESSEISRYAGNFHVPVTFESVSC